MHKFYTANPRDVKSGDPRFHRKPHPPPLPIPRPARVRLPHPDRSAFNSPLRTRLVPNRRGRTVWGANR